MSRVRFLLACLSITACSSGPTATADDPSTGTTYQAPDPNADTTDPCNDFDICTNPPGAPDQAPDLTIGERFMTRMYSNMRVAADATSAIVGGIAPNGGIHDSLHVGGGYPWNGLVPPGQIVKIANTQSQNGFYQVDYDGQVGWMAIGKLGKVDETLDPIERALAPEMRNAFYKNQLMRSLWNKDGPLSSGNCGPTSLAMALHVLGKEPAGLSIEESIHRVRKTYDNPIHESASTTTLDIYGAASKLGLNAELLTSGLSPADALTRIDKHLAKKHLIVLNGVPGYSPTSQVDDPSLYQAAFDDAFKAAKVGRSYTFDEAHTILVLGRDASGKYVVGDPISEVGFLAISPAAMKDFVSRTSVLWPAGACCGTGSAVY